MFEKILEGVFHSCFTFSVPTWVVIIAAILACWLIYWDKSFSRLKVKGKPLFSEVTHNSFEVSWEKPLFADPEYYIVYYRKAHAPERWESFRTLDKSRTSTIHDLSLNTKYKVKVSACFGTEVGPPGEESDEISTKSLAYKIKLKSTLANGLTPGSISKYAVPSKFENNEEMKIQTITIGEEDGNLLTAERKSILLLSAPHSGKTTLVEGIMNYIFGLTFNDPFRLCLTQDSVLEVNDDWIKVYHFDEYEGGRITFPLTIIVMPRFCSPRNGNEKQIYKQIQFIMNSVCEEINLVCLVAKGNYFNLSAEHFRYFKSILCFFQGHLKSNFCAFYTFSDADETHVREIFRANVITPVRSYHVNWSSLFRSNHLYSLIFWRKNFNEFDLFFDFLTQSSAKGIQDNEVLPTPEKREEIKSDISLLQPQITEDLAKLDEVKSQVKTFTDHKTDILSDGDISFTIEEIRQIKKDLLPGTHVTNCMNCFFTCHENCAYPDDNEKIKCSAMNTDGYCKKCTEHCIWYHHKNTPYIFEYVTENVTKSYQEMKMNYEKEKGEELTYDEYLEHLNSDIDALLERLHDKVQKIADGKNELQGIKRSPLARSVNETIDDMMKSEMLKKEKGFERRLEMYKELQKYSDMVRISRVQNENRHHEMLYERS